MNSGRTPLTLDLLIAQLIQLRALYPAQGPRPVHLLNMDRHGDGLVTDVDLDCFDEQQERLTSLLSAPCPDTCRTRFPGWPCWRSARLSERRGRGEPPSQG